MVRPCFLIVDREFPGSISSRKLVLETAKLNVITAYSASEAIETLETFPGIHGIVLDSDIGGIACGELVRRLKQIQTVPIVAICGPGDPHCAEADFELDSFEPEILLQLLRKLEPEQATEIGIREQRLFRAK